MPLINPSFEWLSTGPGMKREIMAIVNPDTSQSPSWRFPVKHKESPIIGYRVWELVWFQNSSWALRSVAAPFVWEGPFARADKRPLDPKHWDGMKRNDAERISRSERAETIRHVIYTAGIHAVKNMEQIRDLAYSYSAPVWGEVALWGRVAQFELGYRAEFCMIRKLWLDVSLVTLDAREWEKVATSLSSRYDCEVEIV